jgi:polar amino acid transport system substrate-binding protein
MTDRAWTSFSRCLVAASLALGATLLTAPPAQALKQKRLRACYNSEFGTADASTPGMAIMQATAKRLPALNLQLDPLPWRRCIQQVIDGEYDAVIGISFTAKRSVSLVFPPGRNGHADDERRMFRVSYVLVKPRGAALDWNGQGFTGLAGPLGTQRGYSVAEFARRHGAEVDEGTGTAASLLAKLEAGRVAGILVSEPQYAELSKDAQWSHKYSQGSKPLQQKSYFLAFSKSFAATNPALVYQVWSALGESRKRIGAH